MGFEKDHTMSAKYARNIFISILIFLPLQYILVGIVGYYKAEPWPAFVFPGFKNVYDTEQNYEIHQTRFEVYNSSEEKIASLSPNLFFSGLPRSQIDGLTRIHFQNKPRVGSFSPGAKSFLIEKSKQLTSPEASRVEIIYRKDVLRRGTESIYIDTVDADTIGTIEVIYE
jgi:hypothetical protein